MIGKPKLTLDGFLVILIEYVYDEFDREIQALE